MNVGDGVLDVPRADEDIGPYIRAGGGQKDRGNPPCRICHSRAGFAFGPPMARLRKNRAALFRPRRQRPAFPSCRVGVDVFRDLAVFGLIPDDVVVK